MNILITGNLSSLATNFVKELIKQKHHLVLASDDADQLGAQPNGVIVRSINPAGDLFRDAMSSYGFNVVIFISTREEHLHEGNAINTGHQLDGLWNTLELCKNKKLKHFFYISSTEVYGNLDDCSENATPQPSSLNGHTLATGEQYCQIYHEKYDLNLTIVRLPNIYGPGEKGGLIYHLLETCNHNRNVTLPARDDNSVSLLHVLDVTDFIIRAIDEEYTRDALVVNLSSSHPIPYSALAHLLEIHYPKVTFHFTDENQVQTKPAKVFVARTIYDWTDSYTFENELEGLVTLIRSDTSPTEPVNYGIPQRLTNYPSLLRWIELIGGAALTQFLSQLTGTLIQFKYIDFRLLFVVIMGTVYGIRTGLYAAILVSLSILYAWTQLGFDWALLIYNVGNWLPFALYFMAGLITGYNRDKSENEILNAQGQANLIYEKYSFLYGVFTDIRNLKDEFRERLLGYRDSFGKIFTITQELDHLQEHAVYLRALSILEEHMNNTNIAIYSLDGERSYARLEASSVSLHGTLARSLKLSDFPEIQTYIEQGMIFQNTELLPNYPSYMVPIFNNTYPFNVPTAMVVIWSVKFEQYSTYYYNLLKVICGLIQASLVRATQFSSANYERMYLPATRVLNHQAFMEALKIRLEMRKNRVSDFQVVVTEPNSNLQDIYSCLSDGVRTTDLIGQGEDGDFYILLSQADPLAAQDVVERLSKLGLESKIVDINQLSMN